MILPVHERLRAHLTHLLVSRFELDATTLPPITLAYPPSRDLGDLGTPVAFELARRLRKAPRAIAQEVVDAFGHLDGIRSVSAAPNGYLNVFLERPAFLRSRLASAEQTPRQAVGKAIVEHTAINPNKEIGRAHV